MNDYLNVVRNNYANFQGRARRREYWGFQILHVIIIIALYLFVYPATVNQSQLTLINWIGLILLIAYSLATIVPGFAVTVRRFHDIGSSGWWSLISFVPALFIIVIIAAFTDSKPGSNKWGPNPKGVEAPLPAR